MNSQLTKWITFLQHLYGDRLFLPSKPPAVPLPKQSSTQTVEQQDKHNSSREEGTEQAQTMAATLFPEAEGVDPTWEDARTLEELYQRIHNCRRCNLWRHRKNFVFGVGNPNAAIMFVGEGPGADEDRLGEPFVGRAGQLLNKILAAMGLKREEVYIANVVKCRPPNNRTPVPEEIIRCLPFLWKQIELVDPPFVVALGATAANALLKGNYKMAEIRGKPIPFDGGKRTLIATYHPAALLRNPGWKRKTWEDMQLLLQLYRKWQEEHSNP